MIIEEGTNTDQHSFDLENVDQHQRLSLSTHDVQFVCKTRNCCMYKMPIVVLSRIIEAKCAAFRTSTNTCQVHTQYKQNGVMLHLRVPLEHVGSDRGDVLVLGLLVHVNVQNVASKSSIPMIY